MTGTVRKVLLPALAVSLTGFGCGPSFAAAALAPPPPAVETQLTSRGCLGDSSLPWEIGLTIMRVAGADRQLVPSAVEDSVTAAAVADQVALDLNCPIANVHVAKRPTEDFAWGVEACGRHGAYLAVERWLTTSGAPGHEGRCLVMKTVRFVRLDRDPAPAIDQMDLAYSGPQPAPGTEETIFASSANVSRAQNWSALVEQASKDLACPRGWITPGFWARGKTTTPVAEGCGQRATYLPGNTPPFMMQSLVHVAPQRPAS